MKALLLLLCIAGDVAFASTKNYRRSRNPVEAHYSFSKVKLGFDQKDEAASDRLAFTPKLALERKLWSSLPSMYRVSVRHYIRPVLFFSEKYQVDPIWVMSVLWAESHFKDDVESPKGALGLMQLMPKTHEYLLAEAEEDAIFLEGDKTNSYLRLLVPFYHQVRNKPKLRKNLKNLELGVYYLKKLLRHFEGNHLLATVAYNMGPDWTKRQVADGTAPTDGDHRYLSKVKKNYTYIIARFQRDSK